MFMFSRRNVQLSHCLRLGKTLVTKHQGAISDVRYLEHYQRRSCSWKSLVSTAEKVVGYPTSFLGLRYLLSDEMSNVITNFRKLASSDRVHPLLTNLREILFNGQENIHIRGLVVLLVSKAINCIAPIRWLPDEQLDATGLLPSQRSLAEITEMIHMGYFIHSGIVNPRDFSSDEDLTADNALNYGNKISILGGDFLLATASTELAKLNNTKAVELMSTAVGDMMEGGFMEPVLHDPQLQNETDYLPKHTDEFDWLQPEGMAETMHPWLVWVYLHSGSLLARSCEVVALLGNQPNHIQQSAHCYGRHMALARQLSRDLHHFSNYSGIHQLQPTNAVLVRASQLEYDYSQQAVVQRIKKSSIVDELSELCLYHGKRAADSLQALPSSDAKDMLLKMAQALTLS